MKVYLGVKNSCALNYQSEYINYVLKQNYEITNNYAEADLIIISETCCCTEAAIDYIMKYLNDIIKSKKQQAKIYLTGCITREFIDNSKLNKLKNWLNDNIDFIIPQNEPNSLLKQILPEKYSNLDEKDFGGVKIVEGGSADLYISNGCMNNCTFCKNNYLKYPLKSMDFDKLKNTIDFLDSEKFREIGLLATNLCQYGMDLGKDNLFLELLEYLESKNNIETIKLTGFAFKDAIENNYAPFLKDSKKIKLINGSLESGSNRLLNLINKGFTSAEIIDFIKEIREKYYKQIYLNLIAGFPTESMEDIKITLEVLEKIKPNYIDICPYVNSSFVASNQYEQLSENQINTNTRIYARVLRRRGIKVDII